MSHDYDPAWDYNVLPISEIDADIFGNLVNHVAQKVVSQVGFESFTVFNADGLPNGSLGIYVNGTSSAPVIGIDLGAIKRSSSIYGVCWKWQVTATIVHEIAHAIEEVQCIEIDEKRAEAFARRFVQENVVDLDLLKIAALAVVSVPKIYVPEPDDDVPEPVVTQRRRGVRP